MKKVLVVGDSMIDHYVFGEVNRLNPEAPHTVILDKLNEKRVLGGAANVAANIASTNPDVKVDFLGFLSEEVRDKLTDLNISSDGIETENILIKKRFISNNSYLLRVDEYKNYLNIQNNLIEILSSKDTNYDLVVVSDYNKGTIHKHLVELLCDVAKENDTYVFADIKNLNSFPRLLQDRFIYKCNNREYPNILKSPQSTNIPFCIVTQGKNGCLVMKKNNELAFTIRPSFTREVVDPVGAGDAFLAGMAHSYLKNKELDSLKIAHSGMKFAEAKVFHFGTYVLKPEDVK